MVTIQGVHGQAKLLADRFTPHKRQAIIILAAPGAQTQKLMALRRLISAQRQQHRRARFHPIRDQPRCAIRQPGAIGRGRLLHLCRDVDGGTRRGIGRLPANRHMVPQHFA